MIFLILVVGLPIILFARLYQLHKRDVLFKESEIKFVYGAMTEAYPMQNFYWECWVLVRRLVIAAVALGTYAQDNRMKFTFLAMCNVLFIGVHIFKRPYILVMDNYFESLSLLTLTLLTLFLIDAPNPLGEGATAGLSTMCFVVGAVLAARIVLSRYESYVVDQSHRKTIKAMAAARTKARSAGSGRSAIENGPQPRSSVVVRAAALTTTNLSPALTPTATTGADTAATSPTHTDASAPVNGAPPSDAAPPPPAAAAAPAPADFQSPPPPTQPPVSSS